MEAFEDLMDGLWGITRFKHWNYVVPTFPEVDDTVVRTDSEGDSDYVPTSQEESEASGNEDVKVPSFSSK